MTIRAKFVCNEVSITKWGSGDAAPDCETAKLNAVSGDENKPWSKFTPSGTVSISITNPDAMGQFKPGKHYFLDITPVE